MRDLRYALRGLRRHPSSRAQRAPAVTVVGVAGTLYSIDLGAQVMVGVTRGLAGAVALSRFLESQLYGVGTRDLTVFAAAGSVLLVASAVACCLPARGSTRVDPMVALRDS